jgi:TPR repeat protein
MRNARRVVVAVAVLSCFVIADALAQMGAAHWDSGVDDTGAGTLGLGSILIVIGSFAFCLWVCVKSENLWGQAVLYGSNALFIIGLVKLGKHFGFITGRYVTADRDALIEGVIFICGGLYFVYKALQKERGYASNGEAHNQSARVGLEPQQANRNVSEIRQRAETGCAKSQYAFGLALANGRNVAKDAAEAASWFRLAATQGHVKAQYQLGLAYDSGEGVPESASEAVKWYRLAAMQGYADAQYTLGFSYEYGSEGVARNDAEAVKWYRLAAKQGHADAQSSLGNMYYGGCGVARDYAEAMKWYRLAAERSGDWLVQYTLGLMYANGEGVARNNAEAVKWYRLAADQGNVHAQYNLGLIYADGDGVTESKVDAYFWFNLAAAQGNASAKTNRDIVEKKMTREQIAEAQRRSAAWKPKTTAP